MSKPSALPSCDGVYKARHISSDKTYYLSVEFSDGLDDPILVWLFGYEGSVRAEEFTDWVMLSEPGEEYE